MDAIRRIVTVRGVEVSYLTAGDGPPILLLHGTFWSRVWEPVLPAVGEVGRALAPDFPGFGHSAGRLTVEEASASALAGWTRDFLRALDVEAPILLAGHDIGGAVAQQLTTRYPEEVTRLALVNSVLYDSWPVPAVERFRDPELAERITRDELVELRRQSLRRGLATPLDETIEAEYLSPWRREDGTRSWVALAAAADSRYTLELLPELLELPLPKLLVWGEDDEFQPLRFAQRFAEEAVNVRLARVPGAKHIPMQDAPEAVAAELVPFFAEEAP